MKPERTCILICEHYRAEIEAILAEGGRDSLCPAFFPPRCGRPPLTWDEIRVLVKPCSPAGSLHLFGGCCLAGLGEPPPDLAGYDSVQFEYCMEMIAGSFTIRELVASGAYLVTPGWLLRWREHIEEWGFTGETAPRFFAEFARQILLLDTGIRGAALLELKECAGFVDRPCGTVAVGIDLIRCRVDLCHERSQKKTAEKAELFAQRSLSEYAMAFDLLTTIAQSVDESDVIQKMLNLYGMLFAAADLFFVRFADGKPVEVFTRGFGYSGENDILLLKAAGLQSDYALNEDADGFLLKVSHGSRYFGVVAVEGLELPEYLQNYLNLAVATIGICGLALHNAEVFREIADTNRQLEQAHTELKGSHLRLLQQEKLASIGQLAAGVAHEINNPIGFVKSNLSSLTKYMTKVETYLNELESATSAEARERVTALRRSLKMEYILTDIPDLLNESLIGISRVAKIVTDLMTYSHSKGEDLQPLDLNEVLQSAVGLIANDLRGKGELVWVLQEIPTVRADRGQMAKLFLNLLANALFALPDQGGEITVATSVANGSVCVTLHDNGCGIPDALLPRIFDPFFTTKEPGEGTGLGLAVSREIVTKLGGSIEVASEPGRGTTFTVRLPAG